MANFEKAPAEVQEILSKPIRQLGLKVEGSPLERFVQQLYKELDAKGFHRFHPRCYLTDEWGCPNMEPVIGIPFYLADPKLQRLESEMNDIEDARQIMMYLRHEAGHAFNYAYALYKTQEWRNLFGPFRRPYRDNYKPVAFSRQFVRHMEGWYAQKHPDEDFAETFAVWLTPRSNWRKRYQGWGAMKKLLYMDRIGRKLGDAEPVVARGDTDFTVEEMEVTVGEFYRGALEQQLTPAIFPSTRICTTSSTYPGVAERMFARRSRFFARTARSLSTRSIIGPACGVRWSRCWWKPSKQKLATWACAPT